MPTDKTLQEISHRMPTKDLNTLLKVSSTLVASLDLDTVLQTAIESAVEVMALETGAIYLLNDGLLYLGATTPPLPPGVPDHIRTAPVEEHPHIWSAITGGEPVLLRRVLEAPLSPQEREVVDQRGLVSLLYVPLIFEGRALGIAIVGSTTEVRQFSEGDTDLCRVLAHQISMAVANAQLYDSLQEAYDSTLEGWSMALEMRDEETSGHTARVAELAVKLAEKLGVPSDQLQHVRRGALLHDIGKMGVPDSILLKPGPLTDEEWVIMRRHPEYARAFLSRVAHLAPALDIPYCHHERWDGAGYPQGLKGEEIPLSARVFAVLDVYEALTSDRPYRTRWSHEKALAHITENAGTQFDPEVVNAFVGEVLDGII